MKKNISPQTNQLKQLIKEEYSKCLKNPLYFIKKYQNNVPIWLKGCFDKNGNPINKNKENK